MTYDDTFKRVTVKCVKDTVLELRGDIAKDVWFFLTVRRLEHLTKKVLPLPYLKLEISILRLYRYHQESISW